MPRWRRISDINWIVQTGVGQPTELAESRFLDARFLFRDAASVFNPRHGYTENVIDLDLTVPSGFARLAHDFELSDGIEITIENEGELLVL